MRCAPVSRSSRAIFAHSDADLEYDLATTKNSRPHRLGERSFVLVPAMDPTLCDAEFDDQPFHAFILTLRTGPYFLINASLGHLAERPFTMYKVFRPRMLEGLPLRC